MKIDVDLYNKLNYMINTVLNTRHAYYYLSKEDIEDFYQEVFLKQLQLDKELEYKDLYHMYFIFTRRIKTYRKRYISLERILEKFD